MSIDLSKLLTERRNANSANIDTLSTLDMLTVSCPSQNTPFTES